MSDFVLVIEMYVNREQRGYHVYSQDADALEVKGEAEKFMEIWKMHTFEVCEDPVLLSCNSATFLWVDNTDDGNYVLVKSKPLNRKGHMNAMFPFHQLHLDKGT